MNIVDGADLNGLFKAAVRFHIKQERYYRVFFTDKEDTSYINKSAVLPKQPRPLDRQASHAVGHPLNLTFVEFREVQKCQQIDNPVEIFITDTDYDLLPPIYDLEPFELCERQGASHQYCMFDLDIQSIENVSSHLMEVIKLVNSDARNFRHNLVKKGRCLLNDNRTLIQLSNEYLGIFNAEFAESGVQVNITKVLCNQFVKKWDKWDIIGA